MCSNQSKLSVVIVVVRSCKTIRVAALRVIRALENLVAEQFLLLLRHVFRYLLLHGGGAVLRGVAAHLRGN